MQWSGGGGGGGDGALVGGGGGRTPLGGVEYREVSTLPEVRLS